LTGNSREAKIGNAQHTTKEKYSDMREKKYRIREMADILGVSTDTLRFYEKSR
jgi:DNA-binding transcriptional regulator YiaG